MASTNQSPNSPHSDTWPNEQQRGMPEQSCTNQAPSYSHPDKQQQQQTSAPAPATVNNMRQQQAYKTPPPPNRSVSREPSMSMSMRQHSASHHHQPVHHGHYGPMISAEGSPNSRSGRAAASLNNRGSSINGDEPKSVSQFNPATIDTHSVHSRRTLASNRVRCGSCLNLAPNMVESNPEGALVLYDSRQSMSPGNMVNPFMAPPPFWQYPQFGMAPAPPPFYFPPPPAPADFETFRKAMKLEKKMLEETDKKERSFCSEFCCGGVAQLLWSIIAITCLGFLTALILALFVI